MLCRAAPSRPWASQKMFLDERLNTLVKNISGNALGSSLFLVQCPSPCLARLRLPRIYENSKIAK